MSLWPLVAEKLKTGREVLFTGLGCDVAALKSYLKANHVDDSKLFTIDLICHGTAVLEIHRQFVESLERKYHSRIKSFTLRHKLKGWTPPYVRAEFEDGREFLQSFYESDYGMGFSYKRESCYNCRFKGKNHQSDITIGDYWGLKPDMKGWNSDGVSIFLVRTEKGEELIRRINPEEFRIEPADVNFAVENNPLYYKSAEKPEDYKKFLDDLKALGLHRAVVNHTGCVKYHLRPLKKAVKRVIPSPVEKLLKKILRRS